MLRSLVVVLIENINGANNVLSVVVPCVRIVRNCGLGGAPEVALTSVCHREGVVALEYPALLQILHNESVDFKRREIET